MTPLQVPAGSDERRALIADLIADVPDFPEPGVVFKDLTPLLASPVGLASTVAELVATAPGPVDVVLGMEARGFILGAPVACALGAGFVPVRKPGKLPRRVVSCDYDLEYGSASLQMHADAFPPGSRVLIVDDILATGGTVGATVTLARELGAEIVAVSVIATLAFLDPYRTLAHNGVDLNLVHSLVTVH